MSVEPAPVGRRSAAIMLDILLISVGLNIALLPFVAYLVYRYGIDVFEDPDKMALMAPNEMVTILFVLLAALLVGAALWHAYFIVFEFKKSWTPGKRLFKLHVVSLNGKSLTYKQCVLREIFRSYCDLPLIIPGLVLIMVSKKHQRLGDKISDTLVVMSKV